MALVAQFLGEDAVSRMTPDEVERTADFIHSEILKNALTNQELRATVSDKTARFAANVVKTTRAVGIAKVGGLGATPLPGAVASKDVLADVLRRSGGGGGDQ